MRNARFFYTHVFFILKFLKVCPSAYSLKFGPTVVFWGVEFEYVGPEKLGAPLLPQISPQQLPQRAIKELLTLED